MHKKYFLLISLLGTISCFLLLRFYVSPALCTNCSSPIIQLESTFDVTKARVYIQHWTQYGRQNFAYLMIIDFLYPIFYGLLFMQLLQLIRSKWVLLAPLISLFDFIENGFEIIFIGNPQVFPTWAYQLHTSISLLKWTGVIVVVGILLRYITLKTLNSIKF